MERTSTMQPFAPGDIFLGLTALDDPTDDHAGPGRIVQYGADLKKKGELWTEGGHHPVGEGHHLGGDARHLGDDDDRRAAPLPEHVAGGAVVGEGRRLVAVQGAGHGARR